MSVATRNRVAPYLDPPRTPLPLPATREQREAALADGVFAAVGALQQLLTHPDAAVVLKAAAMLLDFEKTRLRHARPVAGTKLDLESLAGLEPLTTPTRPARDRLARRAADPEALRGAADREFAAEMSDPAEALVLADREAERELARCRERAARASPRRE